METKSRYEVISELEAKKRNLIRERDGLGDVLKEMEKTVKLLERQKKDSNTLMDRKIEDKKEEIENFSKTMEERKETIKELITSIDMSLERFGKIVK